MRPIVGITAGYRWEREWFYLSHYYINAIVKSGGIPLIIPTIDKPAIKKAISKISGLLLSGGFDVSPVFYGQEPISVGKIDPDRDQFEIEITKLAFKMKMPILAICRGIQVLNVSLGGTLKQRIEGLKHYQQAEVSQVSHSITIEEGSHLHKIIKRQKLMVNSFHREAIDKIAKVFKASAWSKDGIVEAIEAKKIGRFVLGVQFHPECMFEKHPTVRRIFLNFISAAARYEHPAPEKT
jgi:putative glutamine amidotransferase